MLTGSSPFQGANAAAILCTMFRSGAPPRLVALLERLLAQEPAARFQTAGEVVRELAAIAAALSPPGPELEDTLSALPTEAMGRWGGGSHLPSTPPLPAPTPVPQKRLLPSSRRLVGIVALASLALMIVGAICFSTPWQKQPPRIQTAVTSIASPKQQGAAKAERPLLPSPPAPDASARDLALFSDIKQRIEAAEEPPHREHQLDEIIKRSPHFLEARILAIDLAINLYQSTNDVPYLNRAETLVREADLSAKDPRLLPSQFKIDLAARRKRRTALSLLEHIDPKNPQIPELRARWDEENGHREKALVEWEEAVTLNPSWQKILHLARFEQTFGMTHVKDAKGRLEDLHRRLPQNFHILRALAEFELYYGDPERARKIYSGLTGRAETDLEDLSNFGISLTLLYRYDDAAAVFGKILRADSTNITATLNLADVEIARDHPADAKRFYQIACDELKGEYAEKEETESERMTRAQCEAGIGNTGEAMAIAKETLRQNPDDPTILQSAALVFVLARDVHFLDYVEEAIKNGIQPRWFRLPPYKPYFDDPRFQHLVNGKPDRMTESMK
jgi:tetratricopeptide (TPR) repeat protein